MFVKAGKGNVKGRTHPEFCLYYLIIIHFALIMHFSSFLIKSKKLLTDLITFHGNHTAAFTGKVHALA